MDKIDTETIGGILQTSALIGCSTGDGERICTTSLSTHGMPNCSLPVAYLSGSPKTDFKMEESWK